MINWSKALLIGIVPIILILSACSPIASQGQSSLTKTHNTITSETSIGQTFTSRHNGLMAIRAYFVPQNAADVNLYLSVYDSPTKDILLTTGELKLVPLSESRYYTIALDLTLTSYLRDYYVEFTSDSTEPIGIGTAELSSYTDGALYQNNNPVSAQLTFVPLFDFKKLVEGLIIQGAIWLIWLIAGNYLFIIPGYGLMLLLWKQTSEWPTLVKISGSGRDQCLPLPYLDAFYWDIENSIRDVLCNPPWGNWHRIPNPSLGKSWQAFSEILFKASI